MIKTIKKIDLQGNEVWQEVCLCNRCKKPLEPTDFVYETKWTGWHCVKMEPGVAYGFGQGSNPVKHICEDCQKEVESFLNGEDIEHLENITSIKLDTFDERVQCLIERLKSQPSKALSERRNSFLCTSEMAQAIDFILIERGNTLHG